MNSNLGQKSVSEDFYKRLFQESPIPYGIIAWDEKQNKLQFSVAEANPALLQLLNLSAKSLPISTPEAFSLFKGYNNQFLEVFLKNPEQSQVQITYQTGQQHFRLTFSKLSVERIAFYSEDLTELHQNRTELLERKRQLKESHDLAQLGYWIENHKTNEHFWSDQIFKLLQISNQPIKPSFKNYLEYIHPNDRNQVEELYHEAKDTNTGFEINHRIKLSDNTIKYVSLRCYTNYNSKGDAAQTVGIIQDITHIEHTQQALKNSETIFRSVFENAPIAIVLVNKNYSPNFCNLQFSQITGYTMDEILQKELKDFTYPPDYKNNKQQYLRLFNGEIDSFSLTKRYRKKDSSLIWVKVVVSAIKNEHNITTMAIAMVQDISAEKKASEALIKSEYKYRTLIENANDGIGLFDLKFNPIIYNTRLYEMLGYPLEEYLKIDHTRFELFHPADVKKAQKAYETVLNKQQARIECRLRNFEGQYFYCSISYIPVLHEDKPAMLIFRRDISKRKEAELQNEEYRLFLETIMDNLPVSFFAKTTPDFRYLYWNHTIEQVTGISSEEAIGKTDMEIQHSKALAEQYLHEDTKLLKNKRKLEMEHEFTNPLGEVKHFKTIKTIHNSTAGNPIILGLSMDVTQLKDAERKIEQSTQMLKEAQKIAKLGYWEYDVKKDLFFDNSENRQILGIVDVPYFLNYKQFIELVHSTDREVVNMAFKKGISKNTAGEGIVKITSGNNIKHISINYRPISNEKNEVIKLRGTCLDITRIRQSEIALRESENRLKQAEHIAKVGYWNYNYTDKTTRFSDEVWNILEQPLSNKDIQFVDFINTVHPDDKLIVYKQFNQSKENNQPFDLEFRIITQNKKLKYIKATGTFVKNLDGTLERSIGTFQDVTGLKQNEFKLQKITSHLLNIQKLSKTGYMELNLSTKTAVYSNSLLHILELSDENAEFDTNHYQGFIHPDDKNTIEQTLKHSLEKGISHNIQYRLKLKNGKIKYVNEICSIAHQNSQLESIVTRIIQDITLLKEQELEHLQLIQVKKNLQEGNWDYDEKNGMYQFNNLALSILGFEQTNQQISWSQYMQCIHPNDRYSVETLIANSIKTKSNYTLTYRIVNQKTKETRHLKDISSFIRINPDLWILHGTIRDVTDYRKTLKNLTEQSELLKTITDNALIAMVILQNDKHIYVNKRWCSLTGMKAEDAENKLTIHEIYKPETTRIIISLLVQWSKYRIKEYHNELHIKPIHAPAFYAEVYVKEIYTNNAPAFLVLASPRHK
ncbi:MAG: PAS domain-containing protein [Salinivirgaceae bacterium]